MKKSIDESAFVKLCPPSRRSMPRSTPNLAPAPRLPEPRCEFPGSARALACRVARPRATPERPNIFHTPEFSNASRRPAGARVGTREARVLPTTPTALHPSAQGWRAATTLGKRAEDVSTLKGLRPSSPTRCNPVGVENIFSTQTQGSDCIATLDWRTGSRWDSSFANIAIAFSRRTRRALERGPMPRSTPNLAPALRLPEPRSGVGQTSESAVSQISKSARAAAFDAHSNLQRPADLEIGDTAGLETCATWRFEFPGSVRVLRALAVRKHLRALAQHLSARTFSARPNSRTPHADPRGRGSQHARARVLPTTPTALHPSAQGWRAATTLDQRANEFTTPTGLRLFHPRNRHNPVGVENILASPSQGSSFLATLGWRTESRWDSERPARCSADFQSAVSRICNPQCRELAHAFQFRRALPNAIRRYSRLQICATASAHPSHLEFGVWNLFGVWSLEFGVSAKARHCFSPSPSFTVSNIF